MEKKRLYRSRTDSVFFGVCGGLGEYFEVDSTIIRIIFVILTIWGGVGVLLYIIAILVMPYEEGETMEKDKEKTRKKAEEIGQTLREAAADFREHVKERRHERRGSFVFGVILLLLGIMFLLRNFFSWFDFNVFWPVVLIFIGILFIAGAGRRRHE